MLTDELASWRNFYELLGTASGTLVGLLFVAASVSSGVFSSDRMGPLRIFLGASVVNFSGILTVCLFLLAPIGRPILLGSLVAAGGLFGLGYYAITWRDTVRDGLIKRIDLEDRTWYAFLPVACYLLETATGIALACDVALGRPALAVIMTALLLIGIHNAWDITVWSISRAAKRQGGQNVPQKPSPQPGQTEADGD
ncbi:MAG TPA: hypothetical protein VGM32_00290 [Rhodopila sp.]